VERISSAIAEIGAMRDTVDDLLLLSAPGGSLVQNDEDLSKILSETVAASAAPERFRIVFDEGAITMVQSDKRLVATLLRNLVSNALVHAPSDSSITVRFTAEGFSFSNPAPDADPKVVSRAFEAFVGTPGKGSGIGLSLVRRIAEAHGWKASMELDRGNATVSVFY
jgi:signal transduction histidine kinase